MEEYLNQLNQDIKDIFENDIETAKAYVVPTRNDPNLTFPIGSTKKGKLIETCVLMVDIRNSTRMCKNLARDKVRLGKIYSAFIYAMTNIADEYGYVRNIVGDRIMVVFEPNDCFKYAINCAAVMYTVATRILAKYTGLAEFKVGIGIEFGEMMVLKAGIPKRNHEQAEHKGLVWVGDAANIASKLCDFSNKSYSSPIFKVTYEKSFYEDVLITEIRKPTTILESYLNRNRVIGMTEKKMVKRPSTDRLNYIDFAKKIKIEPQGWKYDGNKVLSFEMENRTGTSSSILISGKVHDEFKKANPQSPFLEKIRKVDYPNMPITGTGVSSAYLIVPEIAKIKIKE